MNMKVTFEFMKQLTFEKNLRSEKPKMIYCGILHYLYLQANFLFFSNSIKQYDYNLWVSVHFPLHNVVNQLESSITDLSWCDAFLPSSIFLDFFGLCSAKCITLRRTIVAEWCWNEFFVRWTEKQFVPVFHFFLEVDFFIISSAFNLKMKFWFHALRLVEEITNIWAISYKK